ncbi:hypothetical protein RUM44_004393 [Polyplax serrata]|uniref:Uncharacterized protein n=1 Tax=Polyplax serrata TaxID=468196 RepID=A0ABR1B2P6_POLSC
MSTSKFPLPSDDDDGDGCGQVLHRSAGPASVNVKHPSCSLDGCGGGDDGDGHDRLEQERVFD